MEACGVHPLTPNISAESSGRFQACLLVVLNLPYRFGKDRFARDPKPFDGRTDGGANDLGVELVVMMAGQGRAYRPYRTKAHPGSADSDPAISP